MFVPFIKNSVLRHFFEIELSSGEEQVAIESVKQKYARSLSRAVLSMVASILPILFLDTSVLISVLIPITMVAGTAWFSISLANMKQKFEQFGIELTANLFEAFAISLGLLFTLSVFSLSSVFWQPAVASIENSVVLEILALIVGVILVANMIYKIFIGSIQYDINDAMLTGQNEAAERFFRRSLSLLHSVSGTLREGKSVQIANYYIGVAFFEVFTYVQSILKLNGEMDALKKKANALVLNPAMSQTEADVLTRELMEQFIARCVNPQTEEAQKSVEAIRDELRCLNTNTNESQEMIDTRVAIIFEEIANLLEGQGETLFRK